MRGLETHEELGQKGCAEKSSASPLVTQGLMMKCRGEQWLVVPG